jgi:hypothetical protein
MNPIKLFEAKFGKHHFELAPEVQIQLSNELNKMNTNIFFDVGARGRMSTYDDEVWNIPEFVLLREKRRILYDMITKFNKQAISLGYSPHTFDPRPHSTVKYNSEKDKQVHKCFYDTYMQLHNAMSQYDNHICWNYKSIRTRCLEHWNQVNCFH